MATAKSTSASVGQEDLTRRNFVSSLPLAGAALLLPSAAKAGDERTPVLRLFDKHYALTLAARGSDGEGEEFAARFDDPRDEIEEHMMALPCESVADFAAKMIVAHCYGEFSCVELDARVWREAHDLVGVPVLR